MDGCEKFLISELKDPSSYERISVKIKDTITELENAEEDYKYFKGEYDDQVKIEKGWEDTYGKDMVKRCWY